MSSTTAALPPYNKIHLIGAWVETVLWAMKSVHPWSLSSLSYGLYSGNAVMHISVYRLLGAMSILLFTLVTVHIGASLQQLLEAFIYIPANAPADYTTLYWLDFQNPMLILKSILWITTAWVQELTLIWRLYIVWDHNWKICVLPLLLDLSHIGAAYGEVSYTSRPNIDFFSGDIRRLSLFSWLAGLIINISVTTLIASRLWYMGMRVRAAHLSSGQSRVENQYLPAIFTIIESSALFSAVTIFTLTIYLSGSPFNLAAIDIATQLATLTPLLLIVRVGLGLTHGLPAAFKSLKASETMGELSTFQANAQTTTNSMRFTSQGGRTTTAGATSALGETDVELESMKFNPSVISVKEPVRILSESKGTLA
ncbi:predicted protein [Postia placenta Mad-698-R]|uniref:Uncharacterized protein n=1 Tax=Postia placenta MAD-698-R-SB12 TaxID=670580 RepID=A0A1X6MQN5_9APHY|nr:hypothetical protein POSPLADRAFT_1049346 [Postia placenta MAD-698-R-SB12]EED79820.1 predicted protein [Postia placenta Mad-698-R]OSX58589.1 hypothetical protein POSPLADRAFT_1049346 [Postia placenta MAD-698-R-SB12]